MTSADIEAVRQSLGLDQPLPQQFLTYLGAIARGDLGQSFSTGQPVLTELINRLPASAELTVMAFLLALGVAIPLGLAAALRPGSLIDHLSRIIATLGSRCPPL
ncbi:ABC transporter permease [Gemmobacter sp. 24YEA27]|uniref:ABC transporter permease n=1 Tax=Gemmobacter sp. 24YEA27 TaxID=3040672 RepID=UPI0024B3AEB5|nr:ABC transporter permease [Gemmobacter sp. 24YEA27]